MKDAGSWISSGWAAGGQLALHRVSVLSCCSALCACAGQQHAALPSWCCKNSVLLLDVPGEHSVRF